MTKPARKPRPQTNRKAVLANTIFDGRSEIAAIGDDVQTAQEELVVLMQEDGAKTATVPSTAGGDLTITLVEGSTHSIDEARLKSALGAAMWNKVTTRVLDRKKLDAYIASGEIAPILVAKASTEVPRKPFVKIAKKRGT